MKAGFSETWVFRKPRYWEPLRYWWRLTEFEASWFPRALFLSLSSLGFGATVREARFGAQFVHRILRSHDGTCKEQSEHAAMELIAQLQLVPEREELVFAWGLGVRVMTRTGVYVDDYLECESSFTLAFVIFVFRCEYWWLEQEVKKDDEFFLRSR